MFKTIRSRFALALVLVLTAAFAWAAMSLGTAVQVVYDQNHVPTIRAHTELEAIYTLGYLHAKDRFFQMDVNRRAVSGTLAEMLGPAALPSDVQFRTLGLRRAAERSLEAATPEGMAWLEAYSDGVNAFLDNAVYGNQEDDCSDGGPGEDSSDDSIDGHSEDSSDDRSWGSGDSADAGLLENALPLEYTFLELDRDGIPSWTPLDSLTIAKGLAAQLSLDVTDDIERTQALQAFLAVGGALGFNGLQLFSGDLYSSAPFDPTLSIEDFAPGVQPPEPGTAWIADNDSGLSHMSKSKDEGTGEYELPPYLQHPDLPELLQTYMDAVADIPLLAGAPENDYSGQGSNWFIASGANTESGFPMIANDPHLDLGNPAVFYEAHIQVKNGINVTGGTVPGIPAVIIGCTEVFCWGLTSNPLDVTDVYVEALLGLGPGGPTVPTHTFRVDGPPEPLEFIPQVFKANGIGDGVPNTIGEVPIPPDQGGVTIIVPRRNNGPIVQVIPGIPAIGLSVQYAGWSATQEIEAFRLMPRVESVEDFRAALQYFDVGSQNWAYADIHGNIAYFTSGELPLREDLQNLFFPAGLQPPFVLRDGTHGLPHDWMAKVTEQENQALDYEILPFDEMPQIVNPEDGIILNANNDPIGTSLDGVPWNEFRLNFNGRLYLSPGYASGFRMGRIQQLVDDALAQGPLSVGQFKAIQANNQLLDAEVFVPYILDAFDNATVSETPSLAALADNEAIAEAVARLAAWDFSTPTGIPQGYDPGDALPLGAPPTQEEIDASVAATIYSVWRGQFVQRVIDGTLNSLAIPLGDFAPGSSQSLVAIRRLLVNFPENRGVGSSLLNFFDESGTGEGFFDPRDLSILRSMESALGLLASDTFAAAFDNSTNQDDYRWGKLHRIVFEHPMGGPFHIPPEGSPGNLEPDLPGISRAGGFGAVDASTHSARADGVNEYMFDSGPSLRRIASLMPDGPVVEEVIPGGQSGTPGSPFQVDQLFGLWLVNDYHPLPLRPNDYMPNAFACQNFVPPPQSGESQIESELEAETGANDGSIQGINESRGSSRNNRSPRRLTIRPR